MALSITLLWTSETTSKKRAVLCFALQLGLNFAWSYLFFYIQRPDLALVDIAFLWIAIGATIATFWRHTHLGSYLLWPYLVWVSYASYLNFFIWANN